MHVLIGVLWAIAIVQVAVCIVDDESPDYSRFRDKLRRVEGTNQNENLPEPKEPIEKKIPGEQVDVDAVLEPGVFDPIGKGAQLTLLRMIKIRVERPMINRYDRKLPVDYRLASKFIQYWSNLNAAKLSPKDSLDLSAIEFITDTRNINLAAKFEELLKDYRELSGYISDLELDLQERSEDKRKPSEELKSQIERIDHLFEKIGNSFDVRDLRQMHDVCKKKYQLFFRINNFISNPW